MIIWYTFTNITVIILHPPKLFGKMRSKILFLAALIVVALLASTAWYLIIVNESAKQSIARTLEEKRSLERKIQDLYSLKKTLESDIGSITREKAELSAKIAQYESRLTEAANEINRLRAAVLEIDLLKTAIASKDVELQKKNSDIELLRKGIESYQNDITQLNSRLSEAQEELIVKRSATPVELEPITVSSKPKKDNARVLEVNNEYGFLVADVGKSDGIKKYDVIFIFRNTTLLGKAIVERVGETVSVAKMLHKTLADNVKKGDLISY